MFCGEFNENVIDHFMSPRNAGTIPDADAIGSSGDPNCGDSLTLYLKIKDDKIDVIHLATGLVVGYPPCPYIKAFKAFIESRYHVKVVVGTHPIPMKYATEHKKLPYWYEVKMDIVAPELFHDNDMVMKAYD